MRGAFDDREMEPARPRRDTELTLSSMTLLGIFFGLVLLCGLCFGLLDGPPRRSRSLRRHPAGGKRANHIAGGWLPPQAAGKRGAAGLNRCSQLLGRYGCWAN
jgi:hypothetical protein